MSLIPRECKRLAEVDFPIAEVSRHSAREKSIRHGHPSTLHLWWARRPLAACRAMLLALLLPDPADPHCPEEFKIGARAALKAPLSRPRGAADEDLRQALLKFIADFANWDAAADAVYLDAARALVKAAHGDEPPLVLDPFAGGGSIPLEALRLGCDTFASDLNPVACLILKVLLEDIPRHGLALAVDLRRVGAEVRASAEKELAEFYPPDPDGARPIAYLWGRTVRCEAPDCGTEIPLARSCWLAKKEVWGRKAGKRVKLRGKQALRYSVDRKRGRPPEVVLEIFEPGTDSSVPPGTVSRAKATCPACNIVLPPERVRAQLSAQRGGADVVFDRKGHRTGGARLLAVVTLEEEERGRRYRLPTDADYGAVWKAMHALEQRSRDPLPGGLSQVPDEPVDEWHHDVNRMPMYGMLTWGDLFSARQKLTLIAVTETLRKRRGTTIENLLGLSIGRLVDFWTSLARWKADAECPVQALARQVLPMVWDFAEANPWSDSTGSQAGQISRMADAIHSALIPEAVPGNAQLADAIESRLPDGAAQVWFTDPPYYDAIDYAHCSNFFFVWLKRVLPEHPLVRDPYRPENRLTPIDREIVVDSTTTKGHGVRTPEFYERSMAEAFSEGVRVLSTDGIAAVVFAHKTTEGWEALLGGMIQGGWVITASWPITTEMATRLRARDSAALAASVHLVCRPRGEDAGIGDWGDILRALPRRIEEWMDRLSNEGIRGADLVFACIGPALELYSKYRRVETAEGEAVGLAANADARAEPARRGYLSYVWESVGRAALARVLGAAGSNGGMLEEDARLTALFLWTIQSSALIDSGGDDADDEDGRGEDDDDETGGGGSRKKGQTLIYDVARRFAQPLGIHLDQWEGRIIETDKGVVRLLPVRERAAQLFGEAGASVVARRIETAARAGITAAQGSLFPELAQPTGGPAPRGQRAGRRKGTERIDDIEARRDATTLDRVHAAMLFQDSGATNALRSLLQAEIERGPEFLRLANALSALYPTDSEEKRLLDAMLLAVPRG